MDSKLRMTSKATFLVAIFYAITGVILLVLLPLAGFPPHIAIMGILSLIAAYGVALRRNWSLYVIGILFFINTVFCILTLYYIQFQDTLSFIGLVAYLILTWIATIYVITKRSTFET